MGLAYAPIAAMLRDSVQHDGDALRTSLDPSAIAALGSVAPALLTRRPASGNAVFPGPIVRRAPALLRRPRHGRAGPRRHRRSPLVRPGHARRHHLPRSQPGLPACSVRPDLPDRRARPAAPAAALAVELDRTGRFERIELQRFDRDETARWSPRSRGTEPSAAQASTASTPGRRQRVLRRGAARWREVRDRRRGLPTTVRATLTGGRGRAGRRSARPPHRVRRGPIRR